MTTLNTNVMCWKAICTMVFLNNHVNETNRQLLIQQTWWRGRDETSHIRRAMFVVLFTVGIDRASFAAVDVGKHILRLVLPERP